jgi:hypothetical protein
LKKWIITLIALLIIGTAVYIGYKLIIDVVAEKMIDHVTHQMLTEEEVESLLKDPQVQKIIKEQLGLEYAKEIVNMNEDVATSTELDPKNQDLPQTREEAFQLVLGKYSITEVKNLVTKVQGGITPEEEAEFKLALTERLSEEEIDALKVIGFIELMKAKTGK